MIEYTLSQIAEILNAKSILYDAKTSISNIIIDSRRIHSPSDSLFFALLGERNGHHFIKNAYQNEVRNFVISDSSFIKSYPDANFIIVDDTLKALQKLATYHRNQYDLKVLGISGSNGKTIVKEWLWQMLAEDYNVVRSPKSYNSKIGVPLSILEINKEHRLAIIEAGVSKPNEMAVLEPIIKPTIGILTNILEAHSEGFESKKHKLIEKLLLFKNTELFIYSPDYTFDIQAHHLPGRTQFSWSKHQTADLQILSIQKRHTKTVLKAIYKHEEIDCEIHFVDDASIENVIICWATLLALNYTPAKSKHLLTQLTALKMRLELKNGINHCSIIDDSYSADIASLTIALDFLGLQNQHNKRTLILSDIQESNKNSVSLYTEIAMLLAQKKVNRIIGIGTEIANCANVFKMEASFYANTQAFVADFSNLSFHHETILIKGARIFEFERISKLLTQKIHDTVLEIDLNALVNNLHFYKNKLKPGVKMMAMVKAFSYGSGSFEIANVLENQKIDYLAVAYADEGIALRNAGINTPIVVMSPHPTTFEALLKYKLEPQIYNLTILESFIDFIANQKKTYTIHLKIETGMNRLGFDNEDFPKLLTHLSTSKNIYIGSLLSHLVASETPKHDEFTKHQIQLFTTYCERIIAVLKYTPLRHILNTSGVSRWTDAQFEMVRIGIGLYGFDAALKTGLQTVASLKTTITQIKKVTQNETVGYGRTGMVTKDSEIAIVKIGYADGYNRAFGNGVGKMLVNGTLVPTVGHICMDMCMLDVTGLCAKTGDEVIVFNNELNINDLAKQINTIPYEILTNISQRVKRVYFYE